MNTNSQELRSNSKDSNKNETQIAILGAGSWGSTLAKTLSSSGKLVKLWTRDPNKAQKLQKEKIMEKPIFVNFPDNLDITNDLRSCLLESKIIIFACTSQSMRPLAEELKKHLSTNTHSTKPTLVSAVKGLELSSFKRMSEVLEESLSHLPICALSGPNLAVEIVNGLPTASVIACKNDSVAKFVQKELTVPTLRIYSNTDLIGVELGGSLKNVIAIAAGGVDGLSLGTNAKAALITRGLAEITRIAVALGAQANTLSGLAGLGDLMATCSSQLSRNYRLGFKIARGASLKEAEEDLGAVAEGVHTAAAICHIAERLHIQLPIASQVNAALNGDYSPQKAIMNLMNRPLISE